MLNALQKAHLHAREQDTKIERLEAQMAELTQRMQQAAETKPVPRPTALIPSVLAACLAGALLVSARMRQSREP